MLTILSKKICNVLKRSSKGRYTFRAIHGEVGARHSMKCTNKGASLFVAKGSKDEERWGARERAGRTVPKNGGGRQGGAQFWSVDGNEHG